MRRNSVRWVVTRRVTAITVVALVLSACAFFQGRTSPVPFTGHSVSTVASDHFSVSIDDTYCQTSASLSGASGPDNLNVVAIGPQHAAYYYWDVNGAWYGPIQVSPAGTVFSGPVNVGNPTLDSQQRENDNIFFEGPNHSLYFVWQVGTSWYGPVQVGAPGSTYSAPTAVYDNAGNLDVAAQGPNGSLFFYWSINSVWHGPLQVSGPGTVFSAPSGNDLNTTQCPPSSAASVNLAVAALGPYGQSVVYWDHNGAWLAPVTSATNQEFSSPSAADNGFSMSGEDWDAAYVGPSNSLITQYSNGQGGTNAYCLIAPAGTSFSAPANIAAYNNTTNNSSNLGNANNNITVVGPSHSLYVFWAYNNAHSAPSSSACSYNAFYGPLQIGGAGSAFSVPAEVTQCTDTNCGLIPENVVDEGPSHTLWLYFNAGGTWNGPLQIGGPGTTFDSNS